MTDSGKTVDVSLSFGDRNDRLKNAGTSELAISTVE